MEKKLVIVESPTKARTIGRMLGRNYKVVATVGHLRDLPKSKMGVDIENNFEPKYINVRGKGPIINDLKKEYKKAKEVYLATDPDREGEAISWHLCHILDLDPRENHRIQFQEITKETVKDAIKKPRAIDMDLVDAQQARRVLDRVVGYTLSPLLWKKIKAGLSAGRVQSVALRLICEREEEIRKFIPKEYWRIKSFHEKSGIDFEGELKQRIVGEKVQKVNIHNEKEADEILKQLDPNGFKIHGVRKTKKKRNPYPPYTTSSLQQDAYGKLGFSTGRTMSIAQQLYEGVSLGKEGTTGLITYMRTDSTRISKEAIAESLAYIKENLGEEYAQARNFGKNKKGAQDAHEAVRPTRPHLTPNQIKKYLTEDQFKLYRLIWQRTIASQMKPQRYLSTSVGIQNGDYLFRANGSIVTFEGFARIYPINDKDSRLPDLEKGEGLQAKNIQKSQHFTKPKPRYTEASLVKKLEEDGIGRPSTYSSIIASILSRNYVVIEERKFHTTEIGEKVNDFLVEYFDDIINEEFTAQLEDQLDKIADEKLDWKEVMNTFYDRFEKSLSKAKESGKEYQIKDKPVGRDCPECGHPLVYKHGRNGKFIGCSNFPDCRHTEAIIIDTGVQCPKCNHRLIEKVSKRGKLFYGCENYPNCDFALWDKPLNEKCPKCQSILVHRKNRRTDEIRCSNEQCDYKRENPKS